MSKQNLEKALRSELEILNDQIDRKIIRGLSYEREARRHKFLLSSIARLLRSAPVGSSWFAKPFSIISAFLL